MTVVRDTFHALGQYVVGLLPGGGGTQRLPRRVGLQKALDMMLTGCAVEAQEALKIGLVREVVPRGDAAELPVCQSASEFPHRWSYSVS